MSRVYFNQDRVEELRQQLSERELSILTTLDQVRLATGAQLERLHFIDSTPRHRRRTLQSLTDRRLVHRLDRTVGGRRAGSTGYVFALDVGGRHLMERRSAAPRRRPTTPGTPFMAHALAVTEVYVGLVEAERRGQIELLDFQAEPSAWRRYPGPGGRTAIVKPDAYTRIGNDAFEDSWFIEVDLGTEAPSTLDRKVDVYRAYYASGREQHQRGVFPRVLWLVPTERRYVTVVDVCSQQPATSWRLHQVTLISDAINLMTGATP